MLIYIYKCCLLFVVLSLAGSFIATSRLGLSQHHFLATSSGFVSPDPWIRELENTGNFTTLSAFLRSIELGSILVTDFGVPAVQSIISALSMFRNGTDFFSLQTSGKSNAVRICAALEAMGPTYVKFGQALSMRPDIIPPSLADALLKLHDRMEPFDNYQAHLIIRRELLSGASLQAEIVDKFMETLSSVPVASASIGCVYKGFIDSYGEVAVKVKRPGIRELVEQDAALLKLGAELIESIPGPKENNNGRLVAARLSRSVDEFMSRIFEELDYRNEAKNLEVFAKLYSHRLGSSECVKVVVPEVITNWCTEELLVMEWIDYEKLDLSLSRDDALIIEELKLVEAGISCTLSQLFETGVLHADPHLGNIIKVPSVNGGPSRLGYLDFGMLATVPQTVRDGLACAIVQLVFARDINAVAELFGELQLLPQKVLDDPAERTALALALKDAFDKVLVFPPESNEYGQPVPTLRFDNLLSVLFGLVRRFELTLPPYFLNNARALATLEGIARRLDPSFNVLRVVYPFVLGLLLRNPSSSPVVEGTILGLLRSRETKRVEYKRVQRLLREVSMLTGHRKRKVIADTLRTIGGRKLIRKILKEYMLGRVWRSVENLTSKSTSLSLLF